MAHVMTETDFNASILDSRDLIQRLEWLTDEDELDDDEKEELATLKEFEDAFSGCCDDWKYGISIINESYWIDYCKELVTDCGYISPNFPDWIEIDWEATAENISVDYTTSDINGSTWYAR